MKRFPLHSIRFQLPAILIALMAAILGVTAFVNSHFLEDSYMRYKQQLMETTYEKLAAFVEDVGEYDSFAAEMRTFSETHNINILILQRDSLLFSTTRDEELLSRRLRNYLSIGENRLESWEGVTDLGENSSPYDLSTDIKAWQLRRSENSYGFWVMETRTIAKGENYQIVRAYDPISGAFYLECFGYLPQECTYLLRTPFQSMKESTEVSNRFYLTTGLITVLLGAFIALLLSDRLLGPIASLNQIARRVSQMDFTKRYEGHAGNEIGELGNSINLMSEKLEGTISELKTANLSLRNDLAEKERTDRERNEFITSITHDLKTPISIIQGYAEGLKEGVCSSKEDEDFYLDVILDESQRMSRLVKKLVYLDQIESGGVQPEIAYFDMTKLIDSVLSSYRVPIADKKIHLLSVEGECPVWGDEFLLGEAFTNYLSNAYHYAREGGEIRVFYEYPEEKTVRVCLFNDGDQIPEEEKEKIWSKFYRGDKARTREYGGNGIGLSIVRAVAEKHGHTAGFRNEEKGVTFYFEVDRG